MTDEQKALALLLVLGAGVAVLMLRSSGSAAAYAAPVSTKPCLPCQKKTAPMLARPMNGATHYGNEERTEIRRDERGRIIEVIVHRDATVAAA